METWGVLPLENPKSMTLAAAVARRQQRRAEGRRVVLTNGVFDRLHTGRLHYWQEARALGDALFIAWRSDASGKAIRGPRRPVQTETRRAYAPGARAGVAAVAVFRAPRLTAEIRAAGEE